MIYFLFSTKIRRVVVCWGWALSCCPYLRISTLPLSAGDRLTESQERCASFFEVEGTIFKWFLLSPLLFKSGLADYFCTWYHLAFGTESEQRSIAAVTQVQLFSVTLSGRLVCGNFAAVE